LAVSGQLEGSHIPHFPKPFFRPKKNRWFVQLDGKRLNLGPDRGSGRRPG